MEELRGMPVVKALLADFKEEVAALKKQNVIPTLAVVRVGAKEDDLAYERGILKRFAAAEAQVRVIELKQDVTQNELESRILELNQDQLVHGILLFRPLPKHLSEDRIKQLIAPDKDVDCMCDSNLAHVFAGDGKGYPPCTPQAVIEMIDHYGIDLTGKKVTVVGRSMVVGRPLAMLLLAKNATVTICHTKTASLEEECRNADIIVACAGSAGMIKKEFVKDGQIIFDVGINVVDGKLCGDVDYDGISAHAKAATPVPGGVGTVTTSVLLKHTIISAMTKEA